MRGIVAALSAVWCLLLFAVSPCLADEPPAWQGFTVDSANGEYSAVISGDRQSGYMLEVYRKGDSSPQWSTRYEHDGYSGGLLADDGIAFAYVSFWYHDDTPVIYIYRRGEPVETINGRDLEFDRAKMVMSVSHSVWLSNTQPVYRFAEGRGGALMLEVYSIDGAKHIMFVNGPDEDKSTAASGGITLSLGPDKDSYPLETAKNGNVSVTARFTNNGSSRVFIAHPGVVVPDDFGEGSSFDSREREGRAEILVYITRPDGSEVVLRNNWLRGFEPGGGFHLFIEPGESEDILLGYFSPYYSLGQWDIDEPVFTMPGTYTMRMLYRNSYTKAVTFKPPPDLFVEETPWTGEVVSDTVTVVVE